MKETKKETVVVTEYTTDFGTKFSDKNLCRKCENKEYRLVYQTLYNIADRTQRILLDAMVEELSEHLSSAYCEQGIGNDSLSELIESLKAPF